MTEISLHPGDKITFVSESENTNGVEPTIEEITVSPGQTFTIVHASQEGGKRKTRRTRKNGGKRALSGYMKFVKAVRPQILKENPRMEFKDVGKRLGEKWRALSATEKSRY